VQGTTFPDDENARLCALRACGILDSPAEARFDRLARLTQQMFGSGIVLISLIDAEWQWCKASLGLEITTLARKDSICAQAILSPNILQVVDARLDPRFAASPLVRGAPQIRFYAGAPIRSPEGYRIGVLSIADAQPRCLDAQELRNLRDLADCIEQEIDQRPQRHHSVYAQTIVDHMVDGMITINASGIIESVNPAISRIFGYHPSEVLGAELRMLLGPGPRPASDTDALGELARILGRGRELEGLRKGGKSFPLELSLSEVIRQGQVIYVGTVRDISDRKRIERMKSEFVSTVSHELRTPLTAISGALGLVSAGVLGELPASVRQMIQIAHKNSLRLTDLINDLLDMEKLVAGEMRFDMQAQALMPLIGQALEANRAYGAGRGVKLSLVAGAPDAVVRIDSLRLMQVLSNLLSNAIKYSPAQGMVEVAVSRKPLTVRVTVTDHGDGIPAAFHGRIFQKFAQADASDARQKGGTGLGLAISRELVERMGGWIGFASVAGKDTRFFFELPLWSEREPALRGRGEG
jgi:PAS domain S-box-containing protein